MEEGVGAVGASLLKVMDLLDTRLRLQLLLQQVRQADYHWLTLKHFKLDKPRRNFVNDNIKKIPR